jgi:hypothetical protein
MDYIIDVPENMLTDFKSHDADALYTAQRENNGNSGKDQIWSIYRNKNLSKAVSFANYFKEVISEDELYCWIKENFKHNQDFGVELGGVGGHLEELGVKGIAVSLGDGRTSEQKIRDIQNEISVIPGNLLYKGAWQELIEEINIRGTLPKIILVRLVAGWYMIPESQKLYEELACRAISLLPSGGMLLTDSEFFFKSILTNEDELTGKKKARALTYMNYLSRKIGFDWNMSFDTGTLKIVKD